MNHDKTVRKYPRLTRILMNIASETELHWAASVIENARKDRTGLAHSLVREAWEKRRRFLQVKVVPRTIMASNDFYEIQDQLAS